MSTEKEVVTAMSSLLLFVQQILHNQGYAESVKGSNVFVKKSDDNSLTASFYKVTDTTVREMGVPYAPGVKHSDFVTQNLQFLYSKLKTEGCRPER